MRKNFLRRNAKTSTPPPQFMDQPAPSATLRVLPLHGVAAAPGQTPQQRLSRYKTKRRERGADDPGWRAAGVLSTEHRRGSESQKGSPRRGGSGCPTSASRWSAALGRPLSFPGTPGRAAGQQAAGVSRARVQARSSPPSPSSLLPRLARPALGCLHSTTTLPPTASFLALPGAQALSRPRARTRGGQRQACGCTGEEDQGATPRESPQSVSAVQRRAPRRSAQAARVPPEGEFLCHYLPKDLSEALHAFRVKSQLFLNGLTIPTTSTASSPDPPTPSTLGPSHTRSPHLTNTSTSGAFAHTAPLPGEQSRAPEANCSSAFKRSSRASTEPFPPCRLSSPSCAPRCVHHTTSVTPHWPTARQGRGCNPASVRRLSDTFLRCLKCKKIRVRKTYLAQLGNACGPTECATNW